MKRLLYFLACVFFLGGCDGNDIDHAGNNSNSDNGGITGNPALYGIAYGGGRFVAVGSGGTIIYSDDDNLGGDDMGQLVSKRYVLHMVDRYAGTNFEAACDARGDADMRQVPSMTWLLTMIDRVNGYGTSYRTGSYATRQAVTKTTVDGATKSLIISTNWIAGGNGGKAAYSTDGINWTAVSDPKFGSISIRGIAYGGGKFVAGGNGGKAAYSTDGINWTAVSDPKFGNSNILAIAYDGGKFVAGGNGGKAAYSTDGINWTATDPKFGSINSIRGIAYGGGKFVAGGTNGKAAYSTDGINWTATDPKFGSIAINGIAIR
jgi:hypothetical protein